MVTTWITRQQAADRLGVSTQTIDARRRDGTLRSRKVGRLVRINPEDVDALHKYFLNGEQDPLNPPGKQTAA